MTFGENLRQIRTSKKLTQVEVAVRLGIAKSTYNSYEADRREPDVQKIKKLAEVFGVSANSLLSLPDYATKNAPSYSDEARDVAERYDKLTEESKDFVRLVLEHEKGRYAGRMNGNVVPLRTKVIPLFGNSFAAGVPEPDFGNAWEQYEIDADSPADFAIHVHGDSMEPYLPDGSVALGRKSQPKDGDVGAFLLDGEYVVKQYCADSEGNIYLFSLNRAREDADITIQRDSERSITWFGTILLPRRLPLPY